MPIIKIELLINAPKTIVFDLARDIDFHKESTKQTKEMAVAGVTTGLIGLGENVTWRAKHFGLWLTLESCITEFDYPNYFVDEMQQGNFKSFHHKHIFITKNYQTLMIDVFNYKSPFGILGKLVDWLFLEKYMQNLLYKRNNLLKVHAEQLYNKSII